MNRRWLTTCLVAIAGLAIGLAFAFPSSAEPTPRRAGKLTISIPRGFITDTLHDGIGATGTHPPSGQVLTDVPVADPRLGDWLAHGPPANQVGLLLNEAFVIGPVADNLRLPLTLTQPWNEKHGVRYGFFRFDNMDYEVTYWSGPSAPANDRAAVLHALHSIRPAQ